jgi:hypothetical protein
MLCQVFAGRQRAFVGRRGVERRATVRISVVGVSGARCGFVIDWWAFPRAPVHQGHSMNNGKRPNQSDISRRSCASPAKQDRRPSAGCPGWRGISGGNGGELSVGIFSTQALPMQNATAQANRIRCCLAVIRPSPETRTRQMTIKLLRNAGILLPV